MASEMATGADRKVFKNLTCSLLHVEAVILDRCLAIEIQMNLYRMVRLPMRTEVRPKEAADIIGCSIWKVYGLMDEGKLVHRSITRNGKQRGTRLITVASIEEYLKV